MLSQLAVIARAHMSLSPHHWLIVAAVLFLSATLGASTDAVPLTLALMLVAGVGAVSLFVWSPAVGLIAIIIAGLLVPLSFATGSGTPIGINLVLLAVLVVIWILKSIAISRERLLPVSRTVLPLIAFCVVALLSFGIGQLPWFAFADGAPLRAQLGGLATFLASAAAFLLAATQIRTIKWLQRITWVFVGIGALVVLARLWGIEAIGRLTSGGSTGSLFWTWLVAMSFAQAVANRKLKKVLRISLLALVASVFYLNMLGHTRWSSGWIPPLVAAVVVLWLALPKAGLLASLAGVVGFVALPGRINSFVMVGDNPYSLSTRLEAWRIVGEIVRVNPLLGLGPANYYWYAPLFPILGYSVRISSHNNCVDIVAQNGYSALLCLLWFVVAVARVALDLLSKLPAGFARVYVVGALAGLVGTLVAGMLGDWFIPFVYNVTLEGMRSSLLGWLFLGGVVALEQISKRMQLESVGEASA